MNTYKKTVMTLGIALITIPQICSALDAKGEALANSIKLTYATTISPSHLTDTNKNDPLRNFGAWSTFIQNNVRPYIIENSSIAGIKDTLLMNSLTLLTNSSTSFTNLLLTVRGRYVMPKTILQNHLTELNNIKNSINKTRTQLGQEKYYIAGKKNAQEILLLALDRMENTAQASIKLLTEELQNQGK